MKKKFNVYKSSMFFYVCALLFMIGFGISFYNVTTYVSSLVEAGSLTLSTSWMSIVFYYISSWRDKCIFINITKLCCSRNISKRK